MPFGGFLLTIKALWPGYADKQTNAAMRLIWESRLQQYGEDDVSRALRHLKVVDPDALRPKWATLYDKLSRARAEDQQTGVADEWRDMLRLMRKSIGDRSGRSPDTVSDEECWNEHLHSETFNVLYDSTYRLRDDEDGERRARANSIRADQVLRFASMLGDDCPDYIEREVAESKRLKDAEWAKLKQTHPHLLGEQT